MKTTHVLGWLAVAGIVGWAIHERNKQAKKFEMAQAQTKELERLMLASLPKKDELKDLDSPKVLDEGPQTELGLLLDAIL